MGTKTRKQVAFDLDTKQLQKYYPTNTWTNAYLVIGNHMKENDFKWIQGSVYESNEELNTYDVNKILTTLILENPWLHKCMRDCRQSDIGEQHSLNQIFDRTKDIPEREIQKSKDRALSL